MDGSEKGILVDHDHDWTAVRAAWQARRERAAREDGAAPDTGSPLAEPPPDQAVEAARRSPAVTPAFRRFGRVPLYLWGDLLAWAEGRTSVSSSGKSTAPRAAETVL